MSLGHPTRRRSVRRMASLALLAGVAAGIFAISTDALGAGHLFERVVARVDRFIAGPVPDRPTDGTVLVTAAPATPEPDGNAIAAQVAVDGKPARTVHEANVGAGPGWTDALVDSRRRQWAGRAHRPDRARHEGRPRLRRAPRRRQVTRAAGRGDPAAQVRSHLRLDGRHAARRQAARLQHQDARHDAQLRRVRRGLDALRMGAGPRDLVAAVTRIAANRRLPDRPPRDRARGEAVQGRALRRRGAEEGRLQDGDVLGRTATSPGSGASIAAGTSTATSSANRCPTAPSTCGRPRRRG